MTSRMILGSSESHPHITYYSILEMISFSSLTTALDNDLLTFQLDALVLMANEAKVWGPQFIATLRLASAHHY